MPFDPKGTSLSSPFASNIKPDLDYFRDESSATTLPNGRYPPRQIPQTISNRNDRNNETTEFEKNVDEDTNKIRSDIQSEMTKTRTELKLNAQNVGMRMNQFLGRSRGALLQNLQMEYEDIMKNAAKKISSLRDQRQVSNSEFRSALGQLRQDTYNQIRQISLDFANAIQLSRRTLAQFHQYFPTYLNMFVKNVQQQKLMGIEKIKGQFNSVVNELDTKVKQNRSQVLGLYEQVKQNVGSQIEDIFDEIMKNYKAIEKEMRNMLAERKQNLKDAYSKAEPMDTASAKEYVNQKMESVVAEMNKIKAEMEQKMIDEIKKVINMLRTEVESIMS